MIITDIEENTKCPLKFKAYNTTTPHFIIHKVYDSIHDTSAAKYLSTIPVMFFA